MFSQISIQNQDDYEFDLNNLGLPEFQLMIDQEEGVFIQNTEYRYFFDDTFLKSERLSIFEEDNFQPALILNPDQKEEIIQLVKKYTNLLEN